MIKNRPIAEQGARALAFWLALCLAAAPALGAQTDLSSSPLASTNSAQVKPNIMLLMDTSGSIGWGHMPDEVEDVLGVRNDDPNTPKLAKIGYRSAQCNALYYNPATTYALPKQANGTPFATPSFTAARYNAYDTGSVAVVDLSTSFKAYDDTLWGTKGTLRNVGLGYNDVPQAAYYYVHTGGATITSYASPACADTDTGVVGAATVAASDGGTWTRKIVSATSGPGASDERLNFAIWYTYYRTRLHLIKSAASLAFTPLTDSFRVGFITMSPKDTPTSATINPAKYLPIADFNSTQRGLWFDKLFSQTPGGSSPAREGLARVGRHYAGKQDGINAGMTGDPVQYSCQQNFTIMTTDGYWNAQGETPSGGPVRIDGTTLVGQQDGTLTSNAGLTPRPIWDGVPSGVQTVTDKVNQFAYVPCGTYFNLTTTIVSQSSSQSRQVTSQTTQSTVQNLQSTSQILQSSQQTLQSTTQSLRATAQNLQSTSQIRQATHQVLQSTLQTTQSTLQNRQSTNQNRQSTNQNLQSTSQTTSTSSYVQQTVQIARQSTTQNLMSTTQDLQSTSQINRSTIQRLQSTVQNLQSTVQKLQSTTQTTKGTVQNLQSTVQNLQSTSQVKQSTTQTTRSTSQITGSTTQQIMSTSQLTLSTSQVRQSTSQLRSCDASTELCTPVPAGACTPGGNITCETVTTGPTLVASCTPASANPGNNYVTTSCATTSTGPTPAASCTPVSASSSNGYTTTTCNTVTTGPAPAQTCNPATAGAGNAYTTTTCVTNATGPTPAASCTPTAATAGNAWTTTTCATVTTGPTGVSSCTASGATSGNAYTATTCGTNNTSNVAVASCTASGPTSGNGWTTTTCTPTTTTNVPVATCSASSATAGNAWTTTTCSTNNTTNVAVASCTPSAATSGNGWTTTTCPAPVTTGPVGVSSCSPVAASSGNSYTATTCGTNNTTNVPVASCTASGPTSGNAWTTTTCPAPLTTTNVAVASCTAASASLANSWTTTTCSTNNTTNVAVASCTPSAATAGNSYTTTTCPAPITTGPTPASSCSPVAPTSGNSYVERTCSTLVTTNIPVASCSPSAANGGNSYTATTCSTNNAANVPVASCTPSSETSGNNWTTTTCSTNNTANVAVASCTPSAASSGNGWTTTTCPAPTIVSGPTTVASCTPVAPTSGNGWQETRCTTVSNTVGSASCTPQSPSVGNGWVTITCNTIVTTSVPVASCTPQAPTAGNGYTTVTCPAPIVTTNVPVLSCTAAAASAGNSWTTVTCPAPVTTGPTPVASCTPAAATSGNSWTSTTCPAPATTGPVGVASCTPVAASAGNAWTATLCGTNNTSSVPVSACTATAANAGNGWTTTTCANNDTNVAVASCAPAAAGAGNGWTQITCPGAVTTTDVPVQTCTPDAVPTSSNSYTTTSCTTNNTSAPSGTCVSSAATAGNNWVTTTCPIVSAGPTAVSSCVADPVPTSGNAWTKTTCTQNDTSSVPVAACTASAATAANGWTATTCTTNNTTSVAVATCSSSPASSANAWTATVCTTNNTTNVPVSSCTASAATAGNGWTTTTCPVVAGDVGVAAGTCSPSGPSAGNNWTTTTCPVTASGPTPVASCTPVSPSAGNGWQSVTCSTVTSAPTVVTTCNPAAPSVGNDYTATNCAPLSGQKIQYAMTTTVTSSAVSGGIPVGTPTTSSTTDPAVDLDGACYGPDVVARALPTPNPQPAGVTAGPTPSAPCTAWPCTVSTNTSDPRSINSLADVAQYYYVTDLRPAADWPANISDDDVPAVGSGPEDDRVRWQHMTTFTIALGVSGTLQYRPDYKSSTAVTGDFADIRTGAKNWPLWPDPALDYAGNPNLWNDPKSIDDFWHAAVNGRGSFFSAGNPTSVIAGLSDALAGITARLASASGAGTSSLQPITGDRYVYLANYTTQKWSGDVQAHEIDLTSGAVEPTVIWSAQSLLDAKTNAACDNRKIFLFRQGAATDNLTSFTWDTQACDGTGLPTGPLLNGLNTAEKAYFTGTNVTLLSQYTSMTDGTLATVDQRSLAGGANLVNFLRGQRGLEGFVSNSASKLYRSREHVLGDTVNGQPVYVRSPFAAYGDPGYAAFKTAQATRTPMLYVPANDGMLHAFYAGTSNVDPQGGKEAWSLVPSTVLPNLWKLADNNYKNTHQFSVDGTPSVSDIYDTRGTPAWKTILVAGLNAGGKGYYALDVTDPDNPKGLWEFKWNPAVCPATTALAAGNSADCHLGYTFGKPLVTKIKDGTANGKWVVMVTSGYNNVNAPATAGDGQGYLYVLDAASGQILYKIATGAGDATTPSGLAQINNFVDKAEVDNFTVRVYGTDVLGNIWRFDVNDTLSPSGREAALVGTAKDASSNPQPITTRPEVSEIGGKPMIFVATGRLLGATDLGDIRTQSIYGIIDPLIGSATAFPNLRSSLAPLALTQVGSGPSAYRTVACTGTTAECGSTDGWFVDLPDAGERVNVEMKLHSGTLVVGSNVPQISACTTGGYSWLNYLNFSSGLAVASSDHLAVSEYMSSSLIVGLTVVKLPGGVIKALVATSNASIGARRTPVYGVPPNPKRVSWREVVQ